MSDIAKERAAIIAAADARLAEATRAARLAVCLGCDWYEHDDDGVQDVCDPPEGECLLDTAPAAAPVPDDAEPGGCDFKREQASEIAADAENLRYGRDAL